MIAQWVNQFAHASSVHILLLLVLADFVFGVLAALYGGYFRFSYVADLLKNDILFKLVPYFAFFVFAIVAGSEDIVIPQLDFNHLADGAFGLALAALVSSILNSLNEMKKGENRFKQNNLGTVLAGDENPS